MAEAVRLISTRRLQTMEASLRRLRWGLGALGCLGAVLLVMAVGRPKGVELTAAVRQAEASSAEIAQRERALLPALQDPIYDQFLQEYEPLRDDAERRRYLTAQVLAAAAAHHLDPDLLFALIAAESRFDSDAVSPKGARGLGQMVFATARAVAPGTVRRPEDLHDVPRNLYATALHLRQLLAERDGDLRDALRAYYGGSSDRNRARRGWGQYMARVSTHYAYLKAKRTHRHLTAAAVPAQAPVY